MIKYVAAIFFIITCAGCTDPNDSSRIVKIEIFNGTFRDKLPKKFIITDRELLEKFEEELAVLRAVPQPDVRNNMGDYTLDINYRDGKSEQFIIVYTIYDGVIVNGSSGFAMDKFYKNDKLEKLILHILLENKEND